MALFEVVEICGVWGMGGDVKEFYHHGPFKAISDISNIGQPLHVHWDVVEA